MSHKKDSLFRTFSSALLSGFLLLAQSSALASVENHSPILDPCGKFGKLFSAAVGIGASLFENSFEQYTLVHTRVLTDSGYQTKLKAIKDIQVGDEVLAWDEMQAHDNAQSLAGAQKAYLAANSGIGH